MNAIEHTTIIAEAGINHNGDPATARKLIDVAKSEGADYVKFQTYNADQFVSRKAPKAAYQLRTNSESSQYRMLKNLEFTEEEFLSLKEYCDKSKIGFLSTAFDLNSIVFLDSLDLDYVKIPSGEITNRPYLEKAGALGKPILLSTGMAKLQEIEQALGVLSKNGCEHNLITVLHCTSAYPVPIEQVNLRAMKTIAKEFSVKIGYSDHTMGITVPLAAVAMGATVIEKHFTLDNDMKGPDHKASLEPHEFKKMVEGIRAIEKAMGDGRKEPVSSEKENRVVARKSIHLWDDLKEPAKLTEQNLIMLRPGDGISPMEIDKVVGRVVKKPLQKGHKLKWTDLQ